MSEQKKMRPVTVRVAELKKNLNQVVAESELPPFMLEMILGEYLAGISMVARKEYEQDSAEWAQTLKEGEKDG